MIYYKVWVRERSTGPTKPGEYNHLEVTVTPGEPGDFPGRVALRFAKRHDVPINQVSVLVVEGEEGA